jgi:hypothetical protein
MHLPDSTVCSQSVTPCHPQEFRPVTIEEMEGKRRKDIEEALVKRDIKRQKLTDNKDVPGMVARVNEMNSTALGRRTKMMLPAPQVGTMTQRIGILWCVRTTMHACFLPALTVRDQGSTLCCSQPTSLP